MGPSKRETFERTQSGAQDAPLLPPLRSDGPSPPPPPLTLSEFRAYEGRTNRENRLRALWETLTQDLAHPPTQTQTTTTKSTSKSPASPLSVEEQRARQLRDLYRKELLAHVTSGGPESSSRPIQWQEFLHYADEKEAELWRVFHEELDLDNNGHLDATELRTALAKAGIALQPSTIVEFMAFLTSSPHSSSINFPEFRDFLLLMPRAASTSEIYQYYETRKRLGDDGHGAARVNMEGDVSLSAEDRFASHKQIPTHFDPHFTPRHSEDDEDHKSHEQQHQEEHDDNHVNGNQALKFLLAGGVAGAVSRTATAPFDRLKIFLITRPTGLNPLSADTLIHPQRSARAIMDAVSKIYLESGVLGFWIGNGLNIAKIFPESAIKFLSYESSKRAFAKYVDKVEDSRDISGTSRFISGGIGGLTSQLAIYPVETLKTRLMSETTSAHVMPTMRQMWAQGGLKTFYRGLFIGLVGVFPYSAIDMSTFEALKLAYLRSTGREEPGVLALLAFGSISGSVGATSVYPLNLVRTRLQASGSSGHPQAYTGIWDVTKQTYAKDGIRGFYRGLFPTLAKVVPAVSISYVVYEETKRRLGV